MSNGTLALLTICAVQVYKKSGAQTSLGRDSRLEKSWEEIF